MNERFQLRKKPLLKLFFLIIILFISSGIYTTYEFSINSERGYNVMDR